ncbi:MAG: DNA/RNA non-specific endonuclease [Myxococcota bacterium]
MDTRVAISTFISLACPFFVACESEPEDGLVALLEEDFGGPAGLMAFFSTSNESTTRDELALYGIGFTKHELTPELYAIDDCPQYFPSSDRNKWHAFNGEYYYVDSSGRPQRAYAYMPPIASEARSSSCQAAIGRWGDAENPNNDYDGGHLIGSQLGGWGKRANIVPQDTNFNRGNWAQLENQMKRCNRLPFQRMFYYVRLGYSNSSTLIPNTYTMILEDRVEKDRVNLNFSNVNFGGSNGTSERRRGVDFLIANGCL